MTTATLSPADLQLRDRAMRQLGWDSQVDSSAIGVSARDGVVTLTGFIELVHRQAGGRTRRQARPRCARRANDLQVTLRLERTDADIAADVVRALDQHATLPPGVQAVVHHGHVTLTGTVHTLFQRVVAEKSLRYVKSIKGIVNRIAVTPRPAAAAEDIQPRIVRGPASGCRPRCARHQRARVREFRDADRHRALLARTRVRRAGGHARTGDYPGGQSPFRPMAGRRRLQSHRRPLLTNS